MNESADPEGFEILYEEGPCLIVNKPGGVLTQAPPGIDSMEVRIRRFLQQRSGKTGRSYLGVPHRLDRPVSGVMVFAKHARAAKRISEQFEGRTTRKTYWAIVEGAVSDDEGAWQDYLRKVPGEPRAEVVPQEHADAKHARLSYRVLSRRDDLTCLEIELETGRTHQIRVQASSRSFPILGDDFYGAVRPFGPQTDDKRMRWIALHARSLQLQHPMTRDNISIKAPLPEAWQDLPLELEGS